MVQQLLSMKAVDSNTYPWGVLRLEVEADKVYGDTYWGFQVNGNRFEGYKRNWFPSI